MEKRPYNVLLVDLARPYGGAEVRIVTLAAALQDVVAKCTVAVIESGALVKRLDKLGLPYIAIPEGPFTPKQIPHIRRIIREGNYQIIDAHNVQSILWGHLGGFLARAKGCVTTVHSDFAAESVGVKGLFYESILRSNRFLARQYITVTEVLQAKSEKQGLGRRSTLIPNAVNVPEPMPLGIDVSQRPELGFTQDDFVVGIVARLHPIKGHRYLIDAMAQLQDLPRIKLLILGDGPLRSELEAYVAEKGLGERVCFTGFREDATRVMATLNVVCMASLNEALPFAVLEAASFARPILSTAVGGLATLLEDRKTAYLVPPRDADALAQGLRWLYNNPEGTQQLAQQGYNMVREKFSVQTMIDKTLQVYDQALA